MALLQRVQDILLRPKETWPVIAQEPADTASIYRNYVAYLAAIPAIASFIGLSLIGASALGITVRVPVLIALVQMVVGYVLSLVAVFVLALIVDALAPTFNGTKAPINALKVVANGMTAAFVGGIFYLIPLLGILAVLASLYSIYLIYTGLPVLMKCPPEKAIGYTAAVVICGVVIMLILNILSGLLFGAGMRGMAISGAR